MELPYQTESNRSRTTMDLAQKSPKAPCCSNEDRTYNNIPFFEKSIWRRILLEGNSRGRFQNFRLGVEATDALLRPWNSSLVGYCMSGCVRETERRYAALFPYFFIFPSFHMWNYCGCCCAAPRLFFLGFAFLCNLLFCRSSRQNCYPGVFKTTPPLPSHSWISHIFKNGTRTKS